jgi:hypothetical protein
VQIVDRTGAPWPVHRFPRPRLQGRSVPRRTPGVRHHRSQILVPHPLSTPSFSLKSEYPGGFTTFTPPMAATPCPHTPVTAPLSVPVEDCGRLPGLPGVRKVGPDSLMRRCSDQGCNFGARAGLKCRDTGAASLGYSRCRVARRKVRPDIATFARSRRDLSILDIGEQPAVVVDGVAHLDWDGRSHDCPDVVEQFVARHLRSCAARPAPHMRRRAWCCRVTGARFQWPPASVRPLNGHDLLEPCNRRSLASATEAVAERRRRWPRWLPDPVDRGGDRRKMVLSRAEPLMSARR